MSEPDDSFDLRADLARLVSGDDLSADRAGQIIGAIMDGRCADMQVASLLTALHMKGESAEEIVGAARAMRSRATSIPVTLGGLLDTCGTGGDGLHTFNISTATAIVAASAGVPVAKHGNRSVSSSSGSADVLETLGVRIDLTPNDVARCIEAVGIGFCFAPLVHGAMRHAVPVRRAIGFRSIFNLLGPLTNPAGAEFQLLGANGPDQAKKLATALASLGVHRALVVSGADGLDELSSWGESVVFDVAGGAVRRRVWTPAVFGLPVTDVNELRVSDAMQSAEMIRSVLTNGDSPGRPIVLMNSAAALLAAGQATGPEEGVRMAAEAIDSGAARATLEKLASWTQAAADA